MAITAPYFGNIEGSRAITPTRLLEAKLTVVSKGGSRLLITFTDGNFAVSPVQWEPEEKEYSLTSLTGRMIEKITGWRPYWTIKMNFAGRDLWRKTATTIGMMTAINYYFGATGADADRRFLFFPPGDPARRHFDVILPAEALEPEYLGGKYTGYAGMEIKIYGATLWSVPVLPDPPLLIGRTARGILLTDTAVRIDSRVL